IVEASFKLFPLPAGRATFVLDAATLGRTRDLRRRLQHSPLQPMRMVWLDAEAAQLVRRDSHSPGGAAEVRPAELWIEAGGSARLLERTARTIEEIGGAAGAGVERLEPENAEALWSRIVDFRADFRDAFAGANPELPVLLKVTLPLSSSEEFIQRAQQRAASHQARIATLALLRVGVVHLVLLETPHAARLSGLIEELRAAAVALGGALVVERCAPELKSQVDVWGPPGDDFEVMRQLKEAWDPKGILSPGRFIGHL
ncbi:MAG TPA: FAD-linked oxidase C-terminal domain-containing protein, partial [Terriglobia bacterium]|nr:FAD-linked oxidase C-terminal domain-containing protein [Terriglobia bacterium]